MKSKPTPFALSLSRGGSGTPNYRRAIPPNLRQAPGERLRYRPFELESIRAVALRLATDGSVVLGEAVVVAKRRLKCAQRVSISCENSVFTILLCVLATDGSVVLARSASS